MKNIRYTVKKALILLSAAVISTSSLMSCMETSNKKSKAKAHNWQSSDTLNDWEKELLSANGLSTDIDELTANQKISVQHIYEMITYMNEKYGEEFGYAGYIEPGLMQNETLYVYPLKNSSGVMSTIYVKIDENGDFYDNYAAGETEIVNNTETEMNKFIAEYFKDKETVSYITEVYPIEHPENIHGDDYAWELLVDSTFFISENDCTRAELEEFGRVMAQWACDRHMRIKMRFNLIHHNKDLKLIIRERIDEYYNMNGDKGPCIYLYHVSVFNDRITDYDSDSNLSLEYTHEEFLRDGRTKKLYPTKIENITYNDEIVVPKMERYCHWHDHYGIDDKAFYDSLQFEQLNRLISIAGWKSEADITARTFGWSRGSHKFEFHVVDSDRMNAYNEPMLKLELYYDGIQITNYTGLYGDVVGQERYSEYENGEYYVCLGFDQYALEKYFGIIVNADLENETGTVSVMSDEDFELVNEMSCYAGSINSLNVKILNTFRKS